MKKHPDAADTFHIDIRHPKGPCELCNRRILDFVEKYKGKYSVEVTYGSGTTRGVDFYTWEEGHGAIRVPQGR